MVLQEKYKAVIGLEVHAQLLTESKIFCADATTFGNPPNTSISTISLAHPGTLPKLNKRAVEHAIRMGIACSSEISRFLIFDRKNYFYPDLPKGYQITQDRTPICKGGSVAIQTKQGAGKVALNRIHLEEDAGKLLHLDSEKDSLVDFNRAGVPLIEIVTEPCIHSSEEAYAFLTEIRKLVRYLDICDGNMEEGSLRCDANVSIMLRDATELGKKVEIKNMNSIRNVQRAIDAEIQRQIEILERGEKITTETRSFDVATGTSRSMRVKEELNDYRYFPDPDLSPVVISDAWLNSIRDAMPALPHELYEKIVKQYALSDYDAGVLTETKELAAYFESVCSHSKNYKAAANWIMGPVKSYLNENSVNIIEFPLPGKVLAQLIELIDVGTVNFSVASQRLFPELINNPEKLPLEIAQRLNLIQDSNHDSILPIIEQIIADFPEKVVEYRKGKNGIVGMFMGEVMKRSKGKADPKAANELLIKKLEEA